MLCEVCDGMVHILCVCHSANAQLGFFYGCKQEVSTVCVLCFCPCCAWMSCLLCVNEDVIVRNHSWAFLHTHIFSLTVMISVLFCDVVEKAAVIVWLLNLWCCFLLMVQLTILIEDLCRASTLIYCQYIYCRFLKGLWYSGINLHIFVKDLKLWYVTYECLELLS